uniref:Rho termination factor N-terminal domain-containing protein n=1 Tax=Dulem virus 36 TaxID=3145754 RepID=A0AAU8AYN2_9CAUD
MNKTEIIEVLKTLIDALEENETQPEKKQEEKPKAKKPEPVDDYDTMTATQLYKECCKRGISSQCTSRKKDFLADLLRKLDNGEIEPSKGRKGAGAKSSAKPETKKPEPVAEEEEDSDDWSDEEEDEATDPYAGKSARELFSLCKERGIKVAPRKDAEFYATKLKEEDNKADEPEEEDDDDEWSID